MASLSFRPQMFCGLFLSFGEQQVTNFDRTMSAWLLCSAAAMNFVAVDELLDGDSVVAILFLSLSVAFIAAGSYRIFYPRKVR